MFNSEQRDDWASLVTQTVKNLPTMQVLSLGWKDPLEKEMATHSSISCLENSMDRGAWQATVHGVAKSWTQAHSRPFCTVGRYLPL